MKFNLPLLPAPLDSDELRIGNVYKCKGGGKTTFWIVISFDDKSVQLLGINRDGVITSASSYGRHVFDNSSPVFRRTPIGYCADLENMEFNISWRDEE